MSENNQYLSRVSRLALLTTGMLLGFGGLLSAGEPGLRVTLELITTEEGVRIEYATYPVPPYAANWSQWGQGLVASTGKVYSAVGDHKGVGGNTFVYEYDPNTHVLRALVNLQQAVPIRKDEYGFGKIHGRISEGRDGNLYFTSFYGDGGPGHLAASHYFFRYSPQAGTIEPLGSVEGYGLPSTHMWSDGLLLYAEATDKLNVDARFLVFDVTTRKVTFQCAHPGLLPRDMFVDARGNAYFEGSRETLMKYDRAINGVIRMPQPMPGRTLRRTAGPGPDGLFYGITRSNHMLFRLDPQTGEVVSLGQAEGDTGGLDLDPTGRYLYYVVSDEKAGTAPLVQVDVSDVFTPTKRVLCNLGGCLQGADAPKSYFLRTSLDGKRLFLGLNGSGSVWFAAIDVPDDGRTVFAATPGESPATADAPRLSALIPLGNQEGPAAAEQRTSWTGGATEIAVQKILAQTGDRPEVREYLDRLALIEAVVAEIDKSFRIMRDSLLEQFVAEACDREPVVPKAPAAEQVLSEFQEEFAQGLSPGGMADQELEVMKEYYRSVLTSAQEYVAEQASAVASIDSGAFPEAVRFCLLLPFLHTDDEEWSEQATDQLPPWLKTPRALRICEKFAVASGRFRTAWEFSRARAGVMGNEAKAKEDFPAYLCLLGRDFCSMERHNDAVAALHTALGLVDEKDRPAKETIRLQIVEAYRGAGQQHLAAGEMELFLKNYPDSSKWGKVATERLASLYQAGAIDGLPDEADERLKDPRCEAYKPQIMYIAWASCRRLGRQDRAGLLQEALLKQYPTHALCADVHFAAAMEALAAGDYAKAQAHLETVETQFPASTTASKAAEIRARLQRASSAAPGGPANP